jgi:hypothetical protein
MLQVSRDPSLVAESLPDILQVYGITVSDSGHGVPLAA